MKAIHVNFPVILPIPCGAHTLQLCLKHILELNEIEHFLADVLNIIDDIRDSKSKRQRLHDLQTTAAVKEPLKALTFCKTRWSSIIHCIERLLELQQFINIINVQEPKYWEKLKDLLVIIQPFKIFTNKVQADESNLYTEYLAFEGILKHFSSGSIKEIHLLDAQLLQLR